MPKGADAGNLFLETLDWICAKLQLLDIPYMITGGSAVGFWGHIRTTMDIDIVIQISADKIVAFLNSIETEAYIAVEEAKKAISARSMFNIIPNQTLFKVDIAPLDEKSVYELEKFKRRTKINFEGREIFVISPEDLIISKLFWSKTAGGSERQISDCQSIWKLNQDNLDTRYIYKWVDALGVKEEFNKLA
jgi:hypothetical protein